MWALALLSCGGPVGADHEPPGDDAPLPTAVTGETGTTLPPPTTGGTGAGGTATTGGTGVLVSYAPDGSLDCLWHLDGTALKARAPAASWRPLDDPRPLSVVAEGVAPLEVLGTTEPDVMMIRGAHETGELEEWYVDSTTVAPVPYVPLLGEEANTWEIEGAEYQAGGQTFGLRQPGILMPFLIELPTEPRFVERADEGLAFPHAPVCLPSGSIVDYGSTQRGLRLARVEVDGSRSSASWADLYGLD